MKWIISIFILADIVYQLFGSVRSDTWAIYYEVIHYGTLLSIVIWQMFTGIHRFLFGFYAAYLAFAFGFSIYQIFNGRILSNTILYSSGLFFLLLLITLIKWSATGKNTNSL